jgi:hypothetical protein
MIADKRHTPFVKNEFMEPKWMRAFILSAGGVLLAAALIRFLIVVGNAPVLAQPEPLLGMPLRYAVLFVGIIELFIALICLFGKRTGVQISLLVWLSTNLSVFWIGLILQHCQPQDTCIGRFGDPLRIYNGITRYVLDLIPFLLVLGGYAVGLSFWFSADARTERLIAAQQRAEERDAAVGLQKMSCPSCGIHIKFATQNLGDTIRCPQCQNGITLRKPDILKMPCFFCEGHIEFPSHAIGEKMPCPHCKMGITLKEPA